MNKQTTTTTTTKHMYNTIVGLLVEGISFVKYWYYNFTKWPNY